MQDISDIFLDDILVPSVFVADYMRELGHRALQVYLQSLMSMGPGRRVKSKDVRPFLGMEEEDFKAAICELAGRGIVATESDFSSYLMLDLKRQALDRYYRRKTSVSMETTAERMGESEERRSLLSSINDTFFHGLMGPAWYQAVDHWFAEYGFEESLVYHMFAAAAAADKLNGPNYLNSTAESYAKRGIRTFRDLTRHEEQRTEVRKVAFQVGKCLRKSMTEFDIDIVHKWVADYGFGFPLIEVALRRAVRIKEPNLNYFDSILKSWYEAGIRTREEAENFEKNRARAEKAERRARKSSRRPEFEQRSYDDAYLEGFYGLAYADDADAADADEPADPPGAGAAADLPQGGSQGGASARPAPGSTRGKKTGNPARGSAPEEES